jgi:Ca2+/H+ antiporter, TMEM165/GDT1 family
VLQAFTSGLLLITISELGDKTFLMAMLFAMRYSRRLVLGAVIAALATMTVLSVLLGRIVSLLPQSYLHFGEIALFIGFGLKLLYDASRMPNHTEEMLLKEAAHAIDEQPQQRTFDQLSRYLRSPQLAIWLQVFSLTILAEWGDRTQISTIALAASSNAVGVTIGAIAGHSICAMIAVVGGRAIAGKISERMMTAIGGVLFLIFGIVAAVEGSLSVSIPIPMTTGH